MNSLRASQKKPLEKFLKDDEFPARITQDFIDAANDVLRGLICIQVTSEQVTRALSEGGMPCDIKELRTRFNGFIESQTQGKEIGKVRIEIVEGKGEA